MNDAPAAIRLLGGLPLLARLGVTGFVAVALLGLWASVQQIEQHHAKNDGEPELAYVDVLGAYHGAHIPSPMRAAIDGELAGHPRVQLDDAERRALAEWLGGERAAEMWDDIDLDDLAPVEILHRRCASCHASGGTAAPFATFADVKELLSDKELRPTPREIVVTSLHTHAPGMVAFGLVLALAALATRFGRRVRSAPMAFAGVGVALDLGGWLLARDNAAFVPAIVCGGALYAVGCVLACVVVLLEVWLPSTSGPRQ